MQERKKLKYAFQMIVCIFAGSFSLLKILFMNSNLCIDAHMYVYAYKSFLNEYKLDNTKYSWISIRENSVCFGKCTYTLFQSSKNKKELILKKKKGNKMIDSIHA